VTPSIHPSIYSYQAARHIKTLKERQKSQTQKHSKIVQTLVWQHYRANEEWTWLTIALQLLLQLRLSTALLLCSIVSSRLHPGPGVIVTVIACNRGVRENGCGRRVLCWFHRDVCYNAGCQVSVYAPVELIDQTEYALDVATKVLDYYESYYGVSYPLHKSGKTAPYIRFLPTLKWSLRKYTQHNTVCSV